MADLVDRKTVVIGKVPIKIVVLQKALKAQEEAALKPVDKEWVMAILI